jgi:hypothetical protein
MCCPPPDHSIRLASRRPHLKLPLVARSPDSEPLSGGVGDIVAKRAFAWCCLDKNIRSFILQPSA